MKFQLSIQKFFRTKYNSGSPHKNRPEKLKDQKLNKSDMINQNPKKKTQYIFLAREISEFLRESKLNKEYGIYLKQ